MLGVLVEKAKTTPENYPLSLNSLKSGCNQKNNRSPLMQVEEDQVEAALESLRRIGAVAEIQGSGRVDKYRHLAYDWLGVDKVEMAVMAELLLRGAQTVGELRGRAARMEPIKDMADLRPVLDSLAGQRADHVSHARGSRRGRDAHALSGTRDGQSAARGGALVPTADAPHEREPPQRIRQPPPCDRSRRRPPPLPLGQAIRKLARLREEIAALKREFAAARSEFESTIAGVAPRSSTSSIGNWAINDAIAEVLAMQSADGRHHAALATRAIFLRRHCFWLLVGCYVLAAVWPTPGRAMRAWRWTPLAVPAAEFTLPLVLLALLVVLRRGADRRRARFARSARGRGRWCGGRWRCGSRRRCWSLAAAVVVPLVVDRAATAGLLGRACAGGVDAGRQFVGRLDATGPRQSGAESGAGAGDDFSLSLGDAVALGLAATDACVAGSDLLSNADRQFLRGVFHHLGRPADGGRFGVSTFARQRAGRGDRSAAHDRQRRFAVAVELRQRGTRSARRRCEQSPLVGSADHRRSGGGVERRRTRDRLADRAA